jgi:hypothetical protein
LRLSLPTSAGLSPRNAPLVTVRFAINNAEQTVR